MSNKVTASEILAFLDGPSPPRRATIEEQYPKTGKRLLKLLDNYWNARDALVRVANEDDKKIDYKALMLQEVHSDHIVVTQQFDKHKVCIIPTDQSNAISKFIKSIKRTEGMAERSKRDSELRIYFSPPLTDEELEKYDD